MLKQIIGVLDLQGCVDPHRAHVEATGFEFRRVKREEDLHGLSGIILPGGESTTMLKLIDVFNLESGLQKTLSEIPSWGICAGAILLAREVVSPSQRSLKLLDVTVERNAYGRQRESFHADVGGYPVSYIRAPRFRRLGPEVKVLAERGGEAVWIESGLVMATTFHPELSQPWPSAMHRHFGEKITALKSKAQSQTKGHSPCSHPAALVTSNS